MPMPAKKPWFEVKAQGDTAQIYIFDIIGFYGNDAESFRDKLAALSSVKNIDLHINSPGGDMFDGAAMFNMLKSHGAEITVYIDGLAASMASYIAMVGDLIVMPENAMMMIHNPNLTVHGEQKDLEHAVIILEKAKQAMIGGYAKRSGKTEEEISAIMDAETWMTGKEAVEMGFADVLEKPVQMAACSKFDLSNFQKVPAKLAALDENPTAPTGSADLNPKPNPPVAGDDVSKTEGKKENLTMPEAQKPAAAQVDAMQNERDRKAGIMAAFETHKNEHAPLLAACLADDAITVVQAQKKLLDAIGSGEKPVQAAVIVKDEKDKAREGMTAAIMARAGIGKDDGANNFRGHTLLEMARKSLELSGQVGRGDKMNVVGQAFTHSTSDFGGILSDVADKAMMKGYDEAGEVFQQFTSKGSLSDFKIAERADLGTYPSLPKVRDGAEYKHVTVGDRAEQMQLATYGSMFSITRQAIINDDLSAFSQLPRKMGRAAVRTIGDLVFAILNTNPKMADGKALFHADHKNLGSGAISTAAVDALRALMAKQKDGDAFLNIRPGFLLVPTELRGLAMQVMESEFEVGGDKNKTAPNFVRNVATPIDDARLAANAFYLLADPMMHDTIEVAYLDGNDTPYLEQQEGWNIDGTSFKVRMDAAVKALDWRTMAKSSGVA